MILSKYRDFKIVLLAMVVVVFLILFGCNKIDYSMQPYNPVDVYLAGGRKNSTDTSFTATYWKNGEPVSLTNGTKRADLNDIVVSNNNVYTLGFDGTTLTYWKNNDAFPLRDGAYGKVIDVSTNSVYALGIDSNSGRNILANDGTLSLLIFYFHNAPAGSRNIANAMVVSGNDVYLAGVQDYNSESKPMLWKNGDPINIDSTAGWLTGIAISGTDIYLSGNQFVKGYSKPTTATYWKNGTPVHLTDGTFTAEANFIAVVGNDIYVAGWEKNSSGVTIAKYWKNGVPTILSDGTYSQEAYEIAVSGNDVYVTGDGTTPGSSILWKNGKAVLPFDGTNPQLYAYHLWIE